MDGFFFNIGRTLRDDPASLFDFLTNPLLWLCIFVGLPLIATAAVGGTYSGATLLNRIDARLFRKPGEIVVGRKAGTFLYWLLHRPETQLLPDALAGAEINGPPRQGKTELMAGQAYQYLRCGVTVFVLELSGDLGHKLIPYARAMGKPVFYFDPSDVNNSMKWSPLSGVPEEVAEQAVTTFMSITNTREEFFRIFNSVELRHIIHAVCAHAYTTGYIARLEDCIEFLLDEDYQRRVLDVTEIKNQSGALLKRVDAPYLDEHSRRWFENKFLRTWSDRERHQFSEGLYGQLDNLLARRDVRYLLSPQPHEDYIDLSEALESGGLIVFRLPQAKLGEAVARTLATWVLQRFQQETLDRGEDTNPVMAFLDELHRTLGHKNPQASDSFASWTADVPKNVVGSFEAYQSKAQLSVELKNTLATTARAKYFLGGGSPQDAREAEETLGFEHTNVESRTKTRSGLSLFGADRQSDSVGHRQELRPRHHAEEIRETRRGYCWVRLAVRGHLKAPMLIKVQRLPALEEVQKEFAGVEAPQTPPPTPPRPPKSRVTEDNPDPDQDTTEIPTDERAEREDEEVATTAAEEGAPSSATTRRRLEAVPDPEHLQDGAGKVRSTAPRRPNPTSAAGGATASGAAPLDWIADEDTKEASDESA